VDGGVGSGAAFEEVNGHYRRSSMIVSDNGFPWTWIGRKLSSSRSARGLGNSLMMPSQHHLPRYVRASVFLLLLIAQDWECAMRRTAQVPYSRKFC
jgi:hypothetical protein